MNELLELYHSNRTCMLPCKHLGEFHRLRQGFAWVRCREKEIGIASVAHRYVVSKVLKLGRVYANNTKKDHAFLYPICNKRREFRAQPAY